MKLTSALEHDVLVGQASDQRARHAARLPGTLTYLWCTRGVYVTLGFVKSWEHEPGACTLLVLKHREEALLQFGSRTLETSDADGANK